jgi:hypothetical protein
MVLVAVRPLRRSNTSDTTGGVGSSSVRRPTGLGKSCWPIVVESAAVGHAMVGRRLRRSLGLWIAVFLQVAFFLLPNMWSMEGRLEQRWWTSNGGSTDDQHGTATRVGTPSFGDSATGQLPYTTSDAWSNRNGDFTAFGMEEGGVAVPQPPPPAPSQQEDQPDDADQQIHHRSHRSSGHLRSPSKIRKMLRLREKKKRLPNKRRQQASAVADHQVRPSSQDWRMRDEVPEDPQRNKARRENDTSDDELRGDEAAGHAMVEKKNGGHASNEEDEDTSNGFRDKGAEVAHWDYYPKLPQRVEDLPPEPRMKHRKLDASQCQRYMEQIDATPPVLPKPSGSACIGYDGVLHIQHFDHGAASGTAFFEFTIGLLQWADQHNYLPWIHLDDGFTKPIWDDIVHTQTRPNSPQNFTMKGGMAVGWARDKNDEKYNIFPGRPYQRERQLYSETFPYHGTGVWEHYFLPPTDFVPGDPSCRSKPLVRMDDAHIVPGVHSLAPWVPRAWRHTDVEYIARWDLSWEDWFAPQRQHATDIVERYIRFNPTIERRARCVFPDPRFSLGMHIRHGDKYLERTILPTSLFLQYAEAFVVNGGGAIYVATDSSQVLEAIQHEWPAHVASHVVHQPFVAGRTSNSTAAFDLGVSAHRTNVEALTDMLALSKSTFFLHGLSALSEAVLYLNPSLVRRAINLEDEDVDYKRRHSVKRFVKDILPLVKDLP